MLEPVADGGFESVEGHGGEVGQAVLDVCPAPAGGRRVPQCLLDASVAVVRADRLLADRLVGRRRRRTSAP
ncbi:hypothetical protein [Kitasatospora sp. NPDC090308]|uniref:hypothetical protein n=1 Tax=Kitasatospora sp. NPDC090308 TaxID=3364082 RepID=UPI00382FDAEC